LVRCNDCEDYDLCLRCLLRNKHGHHPAHTFSLGSDRNFCLKNLIMSRCLPGRQFKHAAICDGCEKRIVGTRHKCLACPDWDYCPNCIVNATENHPGHRFVPIYEAIGEHPYEHSTHFGIFCDGPLCKNKPAQRYISGVRYKCAVCDDVDFCANCEALPTHDHNQTHPLVKFKTPVRTVTVSTVSDDGANGAVALGDHATAPPRSEVATVDESPEEKAVLKQEPVEVEASKPETAVAEVAPVALEPTTYEPFPTKSVSESFQAYFVRDAIPDGTKLPPNTMFRQTWTLYNPGPHSWPVGSDVRFVGGDTMFNVDARHPSSVESIRAAMESNKLHVPIEAGQSADFTVTLRTPHREGTAISYWRLKLPNGEAIGHRLWCDIQVQAAISSSSSDVQTEPTVEAEDSEKSQSTIADHTEPSGSRMIFPKLEKESPESSTYEAAPSNRAPTVSTASEEDDLESLELDEVSTDAGFLTDEEYDVLDASDQEYLDAKQSTH
jgi:next-to-BRCA1 protein 1